MLSLEKYKELLDDELLHGDIIQIITLDKLTQFYNRAKIEDIISYELTQLKRYNKPLSILLINIDNPEDKVLKDISNILRFHEREADTIGRWSSEKFIFLLPHTNMDGALSLSEKIKVSISNHPFQTTNNQIATIGIAQYRPNDKDESHMLQRAEDSLYHDKNSII